MVIGNWVVKVLYGNIVLPVWFIISWSRTLQKRLFPRCSFFKCCVSEWKYWEITVVVESRRKKYIFCKYSLRVEWKYQINKRNSVYCFGITKKINLHQWQLQPVPWKYDYKQNHKHNYRSYLSPWRLQYYHCVSYVSINPSLGAGRHSRKPLWLLSIHSEE